MSNPIEQTACPATERFGFLPFDKPHGMTSRDLVNRVQRRLRREMNLPKLKVGHTGTLDPLADGLVILAVGTAARLTPWVLQHAKRYTAQFSLGRSSVSGDLEEPVTELASAPVPTASEIESAIASQIGWIDQTPPGHSAIWVDGQRAHERTRRGEKVEMPTRRVRIDSIELRNYQYPELLLDVKCGSGTYLRSLGMDIAAKTGTVAVMTRLRRTQIGNFHVDQAAKQLPPNDPLPPDRSNLTIGLTPMPLPRNTSCSADTQAGSTWLTDSIRPPIVALDHLPRLELSAEEAIDARHGLSVFGRLPCAESSGLTEVIAVDYEGQLIAILRIKKGQWAPYRVFPRPEWITM